MQGALLAVEVGDKGLNTAFVLKNIFGIGALVNQPVAHPRVEERQLAKSFSEDVVVHYRI